MTGAQVERALRIPALSPGWQASFRALLDAPAGATGNPGLSDASAERPPAWTGFRAMRVVGLTQETPTIRSVQLAAVDGSPLPSAEPGQFVAVRADLGDGGPLATRSYSLSGPPGSAAYRISVKREHAGRFSAFVHQGLRVGDQLEIAAPRGRFRLGSGSGPVLLCSAGVGATPMLAMLQALVQSGSTREVWWLHGARNGVEHAFAAEAKALVDRLPNARYQIWFSAPLATDRQGVNYTHRGRLDLGPLDALPIGADATAYLCGPAAFMADLRVALTNRGLDGAQVRTEAFGAGPALTPGIAEGNPVAPHPPAGERAGEQGDGPSVTFSRSGLAVGWRDDFDSLLELAEACDVPTRWSCRTGVCHNCETGVVAGTVTYDPEPVDPPAEGNVLICCATPDGELVLDL